ncbi:MAG: Asp-tRNA(Asn)/Glu-tRNA(Gln) amidotransferase subunit GatC [Deltaproteobacteria bacterium]|nr:Asp-tRNA(Asn)/Glu-tRNA(Gln) amidotransferase subunit GatC [Deltaproteobacteria bacterium]
MKFDIQTVERIAELSRLEFDAQEKEILLQDLSKILHYVEKLEAVDVEKIQPTYNIIESECFFREDQISVHLSNDSLFKNAPEVQEHFVQVPQMIASHE